MRYNTIQALENSEAAECLSVHTSAGVPPSMDRFLAALRPHLPTDGEEWAVNLQAEGASAVHAAVDMALQVFQDGQDFNR